MFAHKMPATNVGQNLQQVPSMPGTENSSIAIENAALPELENILHEIREPIFPPTVDSFMGKVSRPLERVQKQIDKGRKWGRKALSQYGYYGIMGGALLTAHAGVSIHVPEVLLVGGISLGVLSTTWLYENILPKRMDWHEPTHEFKIDILHSLFSTGAVPAVFKSATMGGVASLGLSLSERVGLPQGMWNSLGFDHLPLIMQSVMAVYVADFAWYWAHRAFHESKTLWPIHEIHHSPARLNVWKAGVNHPLNAIISYSAMIGTLGLLGLPHEAFTLATVMHATNGFLQHSNADINLGWMDRVIAAAKVHRTHHSADPSEVNRNFGNTVTLWDHIPWSDVPVFGKFLRIKGKTFYLPEDENRTQDVGLLNDQGQLEDFVPKNQPALTTYLKHLAHPFFEIGKKLFSKN